MLGQEPLDISSIPDSKEAHGLNSRFGLGCEGGGSHQYPESIGVLVSETLHLTSEVMDH